MVGSVIGVLCDDEDNDGAITTVPVEGEGATDVLGGGGGVTNVLCADKGCIVDVASTGEVVGVSSRPA